MNIAYVRVSTIEQSEARQVEALRVHQIDKWFREKVSGKDTNRPQLQAMLEFAREGDTIYIHDFNYIDTPLFNCCLVNWVDCLKAGGNLAGKKYPLGQQQGKHRHPHAYGKADVDHDCRHQ